MVSKKYSGNKNKKQLECSSIDLIERLSKTRIKIKLKSWNYDRFKSINQTKELGKNKIEYTKNYQAKMII